MKNIKDKQKRAIYSAASLVLCAAALGSFWLIDKRQETPETEFSSSVNESVPTPQTEVNVSVTNIPDDRVTTTTEATSQYFSKPSENKIIKHFSNGEIVKNATTDDWRIHSGIDIAGAVGDPVGAIGDGVVVDVRDDILWGTIVTVDHENGITSEYRGLGRGSSPEVGTRVKMNDKVGNLGEVPVEKSDGVHLHLEICENGRSVDPEKVIGGTYAFGTA